MEGDRKILALWGYSNFKPLKPIFQKQPPINGFAWISKYIFYKIKILYSEIMQLQKIAGFIYAALAGVVGSVFLLGCAPNSANLKIQAGITMRAGNAEPVSNTKVFLTNRSISEIFKEQRLQFPSYLKSYVQYWGTINEFGAGGFDLDNEKLQQIDNSFKSSLIAQDVTDFNGQVSFSNLPITKIYVVIATRLGSRHDANAWCVPVILKQGENKIVLTNENINLDLE